MQRTGATESSGAKASPTGLEFVLVEQPTKRASGDVRKRVRSHVTKMQHQRSREREVDSHTNILRPFVEYSSQSVKQRSAPKATGKVAKAKKSKGSTGEQYATTKTHARRRHQNVLQIRSPKSPESDNTAVAPTRRYGLDFDLLSKSDLGTAFSRGTMSFRTFALDDTTNTVGASLEALGLDVASVLVGCARELIFFPATDHWIGMLPTDCADTIKGF